MIYMFIQKKKCVRFRCQFIVSIAKIIYVIYPVLNACSIYFVQFYELFINAFLIRIPISI